MRRNFSKKDEGEKKGGRGNGWAKGIRGGKVREGGGKRGRQKKGIVGKRRERRKGKTEGQVKVGNSID